MHFKQYLDWKQHFDSQSKRWQTRVARLDAPVYVHDLIYNVKLKDSTGEVKGNSSNQLERLEKQIHLLAMLTNLYHHTYYCEGSKDAWRVKPEYLNTITRLTTQEYCFYTATPLTLAEFNSLLTKIEAIAKSCTANVHLLLSSFAVINHDKLLLNQVVYVEGGPEVKIHVITKSQLANQEVNFYQAKYDHISKYDSFAVSFVGHEKGNAQLIATNGIFEVETAGGSKYMQAVDICLDHAVGRSKQLLENQLEPQLNLHHGDRFPTQVDHVLTSNAERVYSENKLANFTLHVDPNPANLDEDNRRRYSNYTKVRKGYLQDLSFQLQQPATFIQFETTGICVMQPFFGPPFKIFDCGSRKLGKFVSPFYETITEINTDIFLKKFAAAKPSQVNQIQEFLSIQNELQNKLYDKAHELISKLLEQCDPKGGLHSFFNANKKKLKPVQHIIEASSEKLANQNIDDFLATLPTWLASLRQELTQAVKDEGQIKQINSLIEQYEKLIDEHLPGFIEFMQSPIEERPTLSQK